MGIYNPKFGTDDEVRERVLNWTNPKRPNFCHTNCKYLTPWEENQSTVKERHLCSKYGVIVYHGRFHPKLIMWGECNESNPIDTMQKKEKINWWKVPFEIIAMLVMVTVWGSKATHRMITSETKYQKKRKGKN